MEGRDGGKGGREGVREGVLDIMHGRSRMAVDPQCQRRKEWGVAVSDQNAHAPCCWLSWLVAAGEIALFLVIAQEPRVVLL